MEDILISELPLFTGETSGTYALINNSAQTETFKVTRERLLGAGNINPSIDNLYELGNETFRWKSITIGPGTIFITDTVTGNEAGLTVTNGVLLINGANQLQVGTLKFVNNNIQSISGSTDIGIALTGDTANLVLNRNTVLASGKSLKFGDNTTQTTAYIPATTQSFNPRFEDTSGRLAGVEARGNYTMISPKICYFRLFIDFAGCTNFGTGQYQFTLPFSSAETMRQAGGSLHVLTTPGPGPAGGTLYHIAGITDIAINRDLHKLYYSDRPTDVAWVQNTPVTITTNSHFDISGTYEIR
jgi:hypothetical protein